MSHFLPDPAAPGTVDPAQLEKVRELHAVVRKWLDDTAIQQNNNHIRASLPYADLMFAFAFATLGDHPTANKLVEDTRKVMEGPIPEATGWQDAQAATAALVRNFLFKALHYRIEQAVAGRSLGGELSAEVMSRHAEIKKAAGVAPISNPHKLAQHVIDRFRDQYRIAEPSVEVDPYSDWTKDSDPLKRALADLHAIREPTLLADRIRHLYQQGVAGKPFKEVQFFALHEGLPLSLRVGEEFIAELLTKVPATLAEDFATEAARPDLPRRQAELLERALFIAGHLHRTDLVQMLIDGFVALVRRKHAPTRFQLINVVTGQCLESLKELNLTTEIDRLLVLLNDQVTGGVSSADLRKQHAHPESWAAVLQSLVNLAGGWLMYGQAARANPILAEARNELLVGKPLPATVYTDLARAYVTALSEAPFETGMAAITELFRKMDPKQITNTWTTAQYYSRFHLNLTEDAVFAVCRLCLDNPVPVTVNA